ncbi:MAG: helix-turn-helix domain-containing protein [Pyrinomonadaceae bacterium]
MASANLTTKEVARLLHISEATVKRWADDGGLRSEKTVGGHRRFSIQAIARLRRERGIGAETKPSRGGRKRSATKPLLSPTTFLDLILRGHDPEATAALIDAYLHHHTLASLFDTTITAAMHELGELWARGSITIADEHLATRVVLSALQKLRGIIVPAEPTGLKAICCGIEGDFHELPVHLAEMILEGEGWDVINLGPNTPLFALREMVKQRRPQLVCISGRMLADQDRAAIEYGQLCKVTAKLGAAVIVGGEAFRDPNLQVRFPAELYAKDFEAVSSFARALAKKRA